MISTSLEKPTNITAIRVSSNITDIYEFFCNEREAGEGGGGSDEEEEVDGRSRHCGYVYVSDSKEKKIYRVDVSKYGVHGANTGLRKDRPNNQNRGGGIVVAYQFSKAPAEMRDAVVNGLFVHQDHLYFSATNKR